MNARPTPELVSHCKFWAAVSGLVAAFFGCLGLAGWKFSFLNTSIFTFAIWWIARLRYHAEIVHRRTEKDLAKANAELERRVTERTLALSQAVKTLQENEERVRMILDTALDAVITIDSNGDIASWNREAERVFGWNRQEIIGQSLAAAIIPSRYREVHQRGLDRFFGLW